MWSNQHSWRWKRKIWSSSCLGIRRGGRAWQLHRNKVQRKFCNKNLILFAFYCNKLYILLIRMWNLSSNMQYSFLYYLHPIQNYFICKSWNHCKKGILILRIEKKLIRCGQSFIRKNYFINTEGNVGISFTVNFLTWMSFEVCFCEILVSIDVVVFSGVPLSALN